MGRDSFKYLIKNAPEEFNKFNEEIIEFLNSVNISSFNTFKISISDFEVLINQGVGKFYSSLIENKFKSYFNKDLSKLIHSQNNCFKISLNNEFSFIFNNNDVSDKCFTMENLSIKGIKFLNNNEKQDLFNLEFEEDYVLFNLSSFLLKWDY